MMKWYNFVLLLSLQQHITTLERSTVSTDSLLNKPYTYFEQQIKQSKDSKKQLYLAKKWLHKSKTEKDIRQKALAYKAIIHVLPKAQRLHYCDSLLYAAKFTDDDVFIGAAYLTVGAAYYDSKFYGKALENYLLANSYVTLTDDQYLKHKVKFTIASIKYYLGYYHEGIALFKECIDYFEEENDLAYLKSIHGLALCYNQLGNYTESLRYNHIGITIAKEIKEFSMLPYFNQLEGINRFYKKDYAGAFDQLNRSLPSIVSRDDFGGEAISKLYLGKCQWELGRKEQAVAEFKKVDDIIQKRDYYHPQIKETYDFLIAYYKEAGDVNNQLLFMRAQVRLFTELNANYRDLPGKIHLGYDTRKLFKAISEVELQKKLNTIIYGVVISLLALIVFLGYWRHTQIKKRYKQKFEELMHKPLRPKVQSLISEKDNGLNINPEVVKTVLLNLEKFEIGNKFTDQKLTIVKMASLLHTNDKYLSKIIFYYRQKNFIQYLSDLRIDYIVNLLKNEPIYRNYTNKALSETAGFGSTQIFNQAFEARTGIRPTYFVNQLLKEKSDAIKPESGL